jgi:hypothetical protein
MLRRLIATLVCLSLAVLVQLAEATDEFTDSTAVWPESRLEFPPGLEWLYFHLLLRPGRQGYSLVLSRPGGLENMSRPKSKTTPEFIDQMQGDDSWLSSHAQALTDYGRTDHNSGCVVRSSLCPLRL